MGWTRRVLVQDAHIQLSATSGVGLGAGQCGFAGAETMGIGLRLLVLGKNSVLVVDNGARDSASGFQALRIWICLTWRFDRRRWVVQGFCRAFNMTRLLKNSIVDWFRAGQPSAACA